MRRVKRCERDAPFETMSKTGNGDACFDDRLLALQVSFSPGVFPEFSLRSIFDHRFFRQHGGFLIQFGSIDERIIFYTIYSSYNSASNTIIYEIVI